MGELPHADPVDVDRWVAAAAALDKGALGVFERRVRSTWSHTSLISFIHAVAQRREQLVRETRFRIMPSYQLPDRSFLTTGEAVYEGEVVDDGAAVRFRWWADPSIVETVPMAYIDRNPELRRPRNRWK